jgi:hypothetical protein
MNLTAPQRRVVASAVTQGAEDSARKLAAATGREWEVSAEVLSDGPADRFRMFLGGTIQPHFGALLTDQRNEGLAVLVLFPAPSGRLAAAEFARVMGAKTASSGERDRLAIAELSNIVAHGLVGAVADAFDALILLTPSEMLDGTRIDLLDRTLARFTGKDCFMMVAHLRLRSPQAELEAFLAIVIERSLLIRLLGAAAP